MSEKGEEKRAKFDPMTGEPLEEKKAKFDPMTGKPLEEKKAKFDPMTGELIEEKKAKFDPMTGKPIEGENAKFDSMTGEPPEEKSDNVNDEREKEQKTKSDAKKERKSVDFKKYKEALRNFFSVGNFKSFTKRKWFKPVVAVIVVLIVLFAAFEIVASVPKNKVILSAFKTVRAVTSEESLDNEILGISDFIESANKKGTEQNIELGDDEGQISVNIRKDGKNNKFEITADIEKDDDVLADIYMYDDENQRILGFPETYDDVFTYNKSDDRSNYDDFVNSLGLFNYNYSDIEDSFTDGAAGLAITSVIGRAGGQMASFTANVVSRLDPFEAYSMIDVSKAEGTELEIGDRKVRCKGYRVTISKELVKECLDLSIKELDNNNVAAAIVSIIDNSMTESEKNKLKNETEKAFEEMKDNAEDLDVNVYIYKGKIVSLDYKMDMDDVDMKCEYTLSGKNNPLDNMAVNVSIDDDGIESESEIRIDTSYDKSKKDYSKKISLSIDSEGDMIEVSNTLEYNTKSGSLTDKFIFDTPLGEFPVFKLDATVDELKKGKYADIEINKLRLGDEDFDFTLEGSYEFDREGQKIEPLKSDVDIDDLSKKEIGEVTEKINEKLEKNIGKLDESVIGYYLQTYCNF